MNELLRIADELQELRSKIARLERATQVGGGSGGVSDHGLLTGLGDDDHPQYVLASGLRDFTATPEVNNSPVWHAGNDGPGSGLDADTVDGVQGADLLTEAEAAAAYLKLDGSNDPVTGQLDIERSAVANNALVARIATDTTNRFELDADGTMSWGGGATAPVDSVLKRLGISRVGPDAGTTFDASAAAMLAPTRPEDDNSTHVATTEYTDRATGQASSSRPFGRAGRTTAQSIPNAAWTAISFNSELTDSDGMVDIAGQPTRVTCVTPGNYDIHASVAMTANATGMRGIRIHHFNNAGASQGIYGSHIHLSNTAATGSNLVTSTAIPLAAGDYIQIEVYQSSGGALNTVTGSGTYHAHVSVKWSGNTGAAFGNAGVRVGKSNQSTTNGGENLLTWDLETDPGFDSGSLHDTVTNNSRLVAPVAGLYSISLGVTWATNGTGQRYGVIRKNSAGSSAGGTLLAYAPGITLGGIGLGMAAGACSVWLNAGDYVEAFSYQSSGGALNVTSQSHFSMERVGYQANPSDPPSCRAYRASAGSISNASWTVVGLDGESWDSHSMHDPATNNSRITAPVTGLYHISAGLIYASNGTNYRYIDVCKNAAGVFDSAKRLGFDVRLGSNDTSPQVSYYASLTAGDYIEMFTFQNSGGILALNASSDKFCYLTLTYVRP